MRNRRPTSSAPPKGAAMYSELNALVVSAVVLPSPARTRVPASIFVQRAGERQRVAAQLCAGEVGAGLAVASRNSPYPHRRGGYADLMTRGFLQKCMGPHGGGRSRPRGLR